MDNEVKKKLLEMLPDYVFGRLDAKDREFFEQNFHQFPEIEREVDEVKTFFSRLEKMDFDKIFAAHTRNISVNVLNKLDKKSKTSLSLVPRFAIPIIAVAVFFIAFQLTNNINNKNEYIAINKKNIEIIQQPIHKDSVVLDEISENEIAMIFDDAYTTSMDIDSSDYISEIDSTFNELASNEKAFYYINDFNVYNFIQDLNEEKFQEIIEEIYKNEDIKN